MFVAYKGTLNSECVSQYCIILFIPVSSQTLWLVCYFSKYLLEMKGMFTCTSAQWIYENNKFLQSSTWPYGNSIVQTLMWETGFAWDNYTVNTSVYTRTCIVCCMLQQLLMLCHLNCFQFLFESELNA